MLYVRESRVKWRGTEYRWMHASAGVGCYRATYQRPAVVRTSPLMRGVHRFSRFLEWRFCGHRGRGGIPK